ncbi:MAG: helicase-exonuclease AddAB subunit AddA [Moorellales bacterium]
MREATTRWTPAQDRAVERRGGPLMVTAAAGTGKTSVLIERLVRWLLPPPRLDLDRLLVVTFTEAAASEVRERLAQALSAAIREHPEDGHLRRQMVRIGQAMICTLHSFCFQLLKRYFYYLGLDPGFRVMEESEDQLLQTRIAARVIGEAHARHPETVMGLIEAYGASRGPLALQDWLLRLYRFSRSHPHPRRWRQSLPEAFELAATTHPEEWVWTAELRQTLALELLAAAELLAAGEQVASEEEGLEPWRTLLATEGRSLTALAHQAERRPWEQWRRDLSGFTFRRLPVIRLKQNQPAPASVKERVRSLREQAKERIAALKNQYQALSTEIIREDLAQVAPLVRELVRLTDRFEEAHRQAKEAAGVLDYFDLEHLSLRLLEDERLPVATDLRRQFVEVLVDECQDLNPVQVALLNYLAPENLFLVGDERQSIYRFRLAEPRLFQEKCRELKAQGRVINLNVNFRSRHAVVDAVNFLFRQLTETVEEEQEMREKDLICGATYPPSPGVPTFGRPVEVYLLEAGGRHEGDEESEEDSAAREARLVAWRLRQMVEEGPEFAVWEGDRYVPLAYRHICLLFRATRGRANTYVEMLRQAGVPVQADLTYGFFEAPEVQLGLCLLQVIDNPYQDIPLAAVLRSPVVGMTDTELAELRLLRRGVSLYEALLTASRALASAARFVTRLEAWRTVLRRRPLPEGIWQVFRESGYYRAVGGWSDGWQRQANLRQLIRRAAEFETRGGQGLAGFLAFLDELAQAEADLSPASAPESQDEAVRVLSIHKAKGLEFPVVVLADLGRPFNLEEIRSDLLLHRDLGLGPKRVDPQGAYKYPTWAWWAIRERNHREILEEERRILYVGLTRAREHLILVGSLRHLSARAREWCLAARRQGWALGPTWLRRARSYLDWLGPCWVRHADGWPLRRLAGYAYPPEDGRVTFHSSRWRLHCRLQPLRSVAEGHRSPARGWRAVPPGEEVVAKPPLPLAAKVTVSELMLTPEPGGDLPAKPLWRSPLKNKPAFLGQDPEVQAGQAGELTHRILEHLDLARPLDFSDLADQIASMVNEGLLTPEEAARADVASLERFWLSPLGERLRRPGQRLVRELSFSAFLPAPAVYPEISDPTVRQERVLVQGKIDLLAETEEGFILVDFKTGRAAGAPGKLRAYRRQLYYYARAVESIFRRPVTQAYLVFLPEGRTLPVPVGETEA